ncbi:MAG: hypothetical protein JXO72_14910 [Vicinamibacteria bacterium]|nr:hypothetical protein [Vicinamibacteria bacterium]
MLNECVDLREIAKARRWRWRYEASYKAEKNPEVRGDGRWYVELVCRRGTVYPYGGDELAAFTDVKNVRNELLAIAGVMSHQVGDGESTVRFPVRLLDQVAGVLHPRHRRMLAPERARAIGAKTAFRGVQIDKPPQESTIAAQDDPKATPGGRSSKLGRGSAHEQGDDKAA